MDRKSRTNLANRARTLRKNMTESEKRLWHFFLHSYPIRVSCQILIGPYIVDFYCRKVRLSIELDGSQHYEPSQKVYDERRATYLEMEGIKEIRFPNSYVWENIEGVCEVIHQEIQQRRNDVCYLPLDLVKNKR